MDFYHHLIRLSIGFKPGLRYTVLNFTTGKTTVVKTLLHSLNGALSALLYGLNTLFWVPLVLALAVLKLLVPLKPWRTFMTYLLDACAVGWISVNNFNQRLFSRTTLEVSGLEGLARNDWYLVIANHQSWVDILLLQRVFNREVPFLKFFLKQQLIWVPFLGLAWWALDFPFMRRYSKSFLAKNPHLKGKDMETTKKACEKFQYKPTSIMNFVEGTRFTKEKHTRQVSPFKHLLKPKAGGIAFVLNAMGGQLHHLIDVTIFYPAGTPSFWDFINGSVSKIKLHVDVKPLKDLFPEDIKVMDYFENPEQRARFQQWLNQQWQAKDQRLENWKTV
ncbi:MAG TPA: acyltransferase [Alteromonas sp.]|nr:acyltransferase [Alteromonas sp.]HCA76083.1 acyltransferase [Alteromonas sp.]HCL11750.1 acyltransferase [Alteromonas sp.]HCV16991.1 acyltransferase [Alteromonas sp.]|tara:strand:+ start:3924 stop:4922 length:999 start_codon:yes stop_codon:yes gene_type:complete